MIVPIAPGTCSVHGGSYFGSMHVGFLWSIVVYSGYLGPRPECVGVDDQSFSPPAVVNGSYP